MSSTIAANRCEVHAGKLTHSQYFELGLESS